MRFSATAAFEARYRLADLTHAARRLMRDVDLLAVPTVPCVPTLAELERDPIGPNTRLGRWTNFVNLMDLCALAVPGPFREDGLPAGVTFIASGDRVTRLLGFAVPIYFIVMTSLHHEVHTVVVS